MHCRKRAGAVTGSVNVCVLSESLTLNQAVDSGAECSNYGTHSRQMPLATFMCGWRKEGGLSWSPYSKTGLELPRVMDLALRRNIIK